MNVNFKLLQTFLLVAERESFRQAAEESHRTPSAVSMQIKHLEDQVGAPLFIRTTRKVELTADGQQLLVRVREALTDVGSGLQELRDAVELRRGRVSLASSFSIASTRLPDVLARFKLQHPATVVRLHELALSDILEAVRSRRVDFGIGPTTTGATDFRFAPLLRDEHCALIPVDHPLAHKRTLTIHDLDGVPLVMISSFAAMRRQVEELAHQAGVTLNIQCEVQQTQTLIAMAAAGLGVAIAPRIAAEAATGNRLRLASFVPTLAREISIITLRGHQLSNMPLQLVHLLHESLSESLPVVE